MEVGNERPGELLGSVALSVGRITLAGKQVGLSGLGHKQLQPFRESILAIEKLIQSQCEPLLLFGAKSAHPLVFIPAGQRSRRHAEGLHHSLCHLGPILSFDELPQGIAIQPLPHLLATLELVGVLLLDVLPVCEIGVSVVVTEAADQNVNVHSWLLSNVPSPNTSLNSCTCCSRS